MKFKFCSFCINVTKYDVTFAAKGRPTPSMATSLKTIFWFLFFVVFCHMGKWKP